MLTVFSRHRKDFCYCYCCCCYLSYVRKVKFFLLHVIRWRATNGSSYSHARKHTTNTRRMSRGRVKSIFRQSFHGMSAPVEGDRRSSFLIVFLLCHFGALALGRPLASRVWRTSERVWRNWKLLLVDRIWWTFVHPVFHLLSLPSFSCFCWFFLCYSIKFVVIFNGTENRSNFLEKNFGERIFPSIFQNKKQSSNREKNIFEQNYRREIFANDFSGEEVSIFTVENFVISPFWLLLMKHSMKWETELQPHNLWYT